MSQEYYTFYIHLYDLCFDGLVKEGRDRYHVTFIVVNVMLFVYDMANLQICYIQAVSGNIYIQRQFMYLQNDIFFPK
jgi:hypothetical protein